MTEILKWALKLFSEYIWKPIHRVFSSLGRFFKNFLRKLYKKERGWEGWSSNNPLKAQIIVAGIFLILGILVQNYILDPIQERRLEERKAKLTPDILIDIKELDDSSFGVVIESDNKEGAVVDNLGFWFDIPGVFQEKEPPFSLFGGQCTSRVDHLVGHAGATLAQTLYFNCESVLPGGYYEERINFEPASLIERESLFRLYKEEFPDQEELEMWVNRVLDGSFLDLRDYPQYRYTWSFEGNSMVVSGCLDLSDKNYIKEDNLRLSESGLHKDLNDVQEVEKERSRCF